jgi:serine/threonine protein kinase
VAYEIVTLRHPFAEGVRDLNQLHRRINKGAPPLPPDVRCSQQVRSLLVSMLNQEPSRRPTMTQVLMHPALKVGPCVEAAQNILRNTFDTLVAVDFLSQMPPD